MDTKTALPEGKNKKTFFDYWKQFENSPVPLALKWTLYISVLIIVGMVMLGTFLITQHERSYQQQSASMGRIIVEQLAHTASEPLMADDYASLDLLLSQQSQNPLLIGLEIYDNKMKAVSSTGHFPRHFDANQLQFDWSETRADGSELHATSFVSNIRYQDVNAGFARITLNNAQLEESLHSLQSLLVMMTALFILITLLFAFPLARRLSQPINQLIKGNTDTGEMPQITFDNRLDELGQLASSFKQMSQHKQQKDLIEQTFHRYVSPNVARHLIEESNIHLGGQLVNGSVLFCDIVGFTNISEDMTPAETVELLNSYFNYFSLAADQSQGTVDKFIGDCIMVLFGIPNEDTHHGLHAITCALLMQALTEHINRQRQQQNLVTLQFRIGIASGEMLAGNLGGEQRMEYTVVGDTVNLASRLCSLSAPGGITIHGKTREQAGVQEYIHSQSLGEIAIRGRRKAATVYQVSGLTGAYSYAVKQALDAIVSVE